MPALYLPLVKPHVQIQFLKSFQRISPSPNFREIFLNVVSCYGFELSATRSATELEDTTSRMCTLLYSVYYQLPSLCERDLLHRNLSSPRTLMTWMHLIWLMIHSSYHHNYHHHLVYSVAVTVLLIIFIY